MCPKPRESTSCSPRAGDQSGSGPPDMAEPRPMDRPAKGSSRASHPEMVVSAVPPTRRQAPQVRAAANSRTALVRDVDINSREGSIAGSARQPNWGLGWSARPGSLTG